MFEKTDLANALKSAIAKKGVTQKAVADHFGVQQPSVADWLAHGRISKKHIEKLVAYFSDVVGPDHWGLPATWAPGSMPPPNPPPFSPETMAKLNEQPAAIKQWLEQVVKVALSAPSMPQKIVKLDQRRAI